MGQDGCSEWSGAVNPWAAHHGCSTEAEIRDILEGVVKPAQRIRMGDALAKIGRSG